MAAESASLPTISAVVVTYHSGPALKECLYSLCANDEISEIIIVNNGNEPDVVEWLNTFGCPQDGRRYQVISGHGNIGFAAGLNIGTRAAKSECLLIINPDAVLRYRSLPSLEEARLIGKSPCLVGGKLFYPDGREQRGGRRELLTLPRAFVSFSGLSRLEKRFPRLRDLHREHDPEPSGPVHMPVISGAFCYITKSDFEMVDGFDEGYFLHVEDIDFCRRVGEAGGDVIYTPKAGAMHYGSTSKTSKSLVEWYKAKGLTYYFRKYAKSDLERFVAVGSFAFFAALLVGRSKFIRTKQSLKQAIHDIFLKLR